MNSKNTQYKENAKEIFALLEGTRAIVLSTVSDGKPTVRIVNCLGVNVEEQRIDFMIPGHKSVVRDIRANPHVAITNGAMGSTECIVRLCGEAEILDADAREEYIKRQPWFGNFFKGTGRENLVPFTLRNGYGEIFDMREAGPERAPSRLRFEFGTGKAVPAGNVIDQEKCISCGACMANCPQHTIEFDEATNTYMIDSYTCLECGACSEACPAGAIIDAPGL